MADTLTLLANQVQDVDGPAVFYSPLSGETATVTLTGTTNGGIVTISIFDLVFQTWTPVGTVTDAQPTFNYTIGSPTAGAIRASLAGGGSAANATVTAALSP